MYNFWITVESGFPEPIWYRGVLWITGFIVKANIYEMKKMKVKQITVIRLYYWYSTVHLNALNFRKLLKLCGASLPFLVEIIQNITKMLQKTIIYRYIGLLVNWCFINHGCIIWSAFG